MSSWSLDDVGQTPLPALPGLEEVPAPDLRIVAASLAVEPVRGDDHGRREAGAGRLAEKPHRSVVALVVAGRRVVVVDAVNQHALPAGRGEVDRHRGAEGVDLLDDQRVDVGIDGIDPGRNEDARPVAAHLMHVVDDLGVPGVVHLLDGQPRLLLAEDVPVAVVVVAGVAVVELGQRRCLVGRPEPAVVPGVHLVDAVGIERRHQQENRVRQDRAMAGRVVGEQVVRELHRSHRRGHFGGMDGAGDDDDGLALRGQLGRLLRGRGPGVGQPADDPPVPLQIGDRLGTGDRGEDHRPPLRSRAEFVDEHGFAGRVERAEVAQHIRPRDQLAVRAHGVSEVRLRDGQLRLGRQHEQHRQPDRGKSDRRRSAATAGKPAGRHLRRSLHAPRRHDDPHDPAATSSSAGHRHSR